MIQQTLASLMEEEHDPFKNEPAGAQQKEAFDAWNAMELAMHAFSCACATKDRELFIVAIQHAADKAAALNTKLYEMGQAISDLPKDKPLW